MSIINFKDVFRKWYQFYKKKEKKKRLVTEKEGIVICKSKCMQINSLEAETEHSD